MLEVLEITSQSSIQSCKISQKDLLSTCKFIYTRSQKVLWILVFTKMICRNFQSQFLGVKLHFNSTNFRKWLRIGYTLHVKCIWVKFFFLLIFISSCTLKHNLWTCYWGNIFGNRRLMSSCLKNASQVNIGVSQYKPLCDVTNIYM